MGDVDGGDAEAAGQGGDLRASLHTQLRIEIRQRLVHEEDLRGPDDGSTHRHTLPLPTGQSFRLAVEVRLQVEQSGGLLDALIAFLLRHSCDLQGESHVLAHAHMRVERIVLEHHRNIAFPGGEVRDIVLADADVPGIDGFESGEHAQGRRLPAARRADKDEEFPVGDIEADLVDGGRQRFRILTQCFVEGDCGHEFSTFHGCVRTRRSTVIGQ